MAEYKYPGDVRWLTHDNPHILFAELAREQGPVVPLASRRKLVVINGLETITEVLKDQADKLKRPTSPRVLQNSPGTWSVEIKDGEAHKQHKRIVVDAIHDFVTSRNPEVEAHASQTIDFIIDEIATGRPIDPDLPVGAGIISHAYFLNFGSILTREMAFELASEMNNLEHFIQSAVPGRFGTFKQELAPPVEKQTSADEFDIFLKNRDAMVEQVKKQIAEHRRSFDPNNLRDMTDGLIKASNDYSQRSPKDMRLSEKDILIGSLFQLFGASKGTLFFFMMYALHYMAVWPEIQTAIQKELDKITARGAQPGSSHRREMSLTEACMWEILRHSSLMALPAFNYETKQEVTAAGRKLDKGTIIFVNYYSTTRDERYWPEPESFDPMRFLDRDGKIDSDQTNKFLPFGIGPHKCLANHWAQTSMLTLFATLVSRCRFEMAPSTPRRLKQQANIFLLPHKYELIAVRRESVV
uniref:Cytochrome P450 n=1 Tax=Candidatus Kentrum sp. FW TaxID=2126338 RepID=A0A450TVV4_9GAMM|nr:MAG: Cytochrome P450 [Candidatus Kentron sp. FW]